MNDLCSVTTPEQRLREGLTLASPRYELLPLADMREAAGLLPDGALVTVTCSPRHGIERTLEEAEWLWSALDEADGFAGLHVYSFNQVGATRAWLEALHATRGSGTDPVAAALSPSGDSGSGIVKPAARY